MPNVDRASPAVWHERKERFLAELKRRTGLEFSLGKRTGSRMAEGPRGTLYLPAAVEKRGGWWLGLNERAFFADPRAFGVVLLCGRGDELVDFWFSADEVRALLPQLSPGQNDERQFNIVGRRDRFWLRLPGRGEIEITAKHGETSSLDAGSREPGRRAAAADVMPSRQPPFLARVRRGRLEPLDPISLQEGTVVVVRVSPAPSVPRHAALRRIVAAAGATDLPADFAEQHDHYAHGAPRR